MNKLKNVTGLLFVVCNKLYERLTLFSNTTRGSGFTGYIISTSIVSIILIIGIEITVSQIIIIHAVFVFLGIRYFGNEQARTEYYIEFSNLSNSKQVLSFLFCFIYLLLSLIIYFFCLRKLNGF